MEKHLKMTHSPSSIEDSLVCRVNELPEEILELILKKYLGTEDLDSCFKVCSKWRHTLNKDGIWQKRCIYDKKYFLIPWQCPSEDSIVGNSTGICLWKACYDKERSLVDSWTRGKFTTEEATSGIAGCLTDYIDDRGNHWLFQYNSNDINIWEITKSAKLHASFHTDDSFIGLWQVKDKILLHRSDYIRVFKFEHPHHELIPAFKFIFDKENVLTEETEVTEDYYSSSSRHLVADKYFVGYYENIQEWQSCKLHVWDLSLGEKVGEPDIYQQSFVDFVKSINNVDVTKGLNGGLLLFGGDSTDILVATIDDGHGLCQVSLFSLENRRFLNVIVQLKSSRVWCFMENDVIAVHSLVEDHSQIVLHDKSGNVLTCLKIAFAHNPFFSNQFWFCCNKVILSHTDIITIVDIDLKQKVVKRSNFKVVEHYKILGFYKPRFLILFTELSTSESHCNKNYLVSVWDTESGRFLFNLTSVENINIVRSWFQTSRFPGKIVIPRNSNTLCFLDFCTSN